MEKIINKLETLKYVLSNKFKQTVISADIQSKPLHGGTLGNVSLIKGYAETLNGVKLPYSIVLKVQNKWERYGDSESWRREYDLYASSLKTTFSETLCWPTCYLAEINEEHDETQLWLEYIEGLTGLELTSDVYEQAALELGRYQGKLYKEKPYELTKLTNLSNVDLMKNTYFHYRSWPLVYNYIRSDECTFPQHLKQMIIDIDEHADEIIAGIETLPLVLCHRDFWVNNLIYANEKIALIDWDTAGWGYMGEDLASLIADEADNEHLVEHYERCISAYYKGFSEHVDVSSIKNNYVYEMILLVFGYRLVEWFLHTEDEEEKSKHLQTLQKIYEIKSVAYRS